MTSDASDATDEPTPPPSLLEATGTEAPLPKKSPPRTLKLTLEYDGTHYQGWQLQASAPTIQGELEARLTRILGRLHRVHGAGRTDAGVHARGQVAHIYTEHRMPVSELHRALNATLPRDIAIVALEDAPLGFHSRFTPHTKRYTYQFWTRPERSPFFDAFVWHQHKGLNFEGMQRASEALVGLHDFSSFRAADCSAKDALRRVSAIRFVERQAHLWAVEVEGPGFLKHMVRNIVGALTEVGLGRRPEEWIGELLEKRDRRLAARTAPARGLCLEWVRYEPMVAASPGSLALSAENGAEGEASSGEE